MAEALTVPEVSALATILDAASSGRRVRWLGDDGSTVHEGVARHVVAGPEPHQWHFLPKGQDVRDAWLRITSRTGLDHAVPVARLVELVHGGGFAVDGG